MLNEEIYNKLSSLTEREHELLKNKNFNHAFKKSINKEFFKDQYISVEKHTRFIKTPKHSHNFIELAYVYNGKMVQKINNKEIILGKGEMVLLNQFIEHEIDMTNQDDIIINFIIKPDFFDNIVSLFDSENIISKFLLTSIYGGTKKGEYIYFHVGNIGSVQNIIENIVEEMYNTHPLKNIRMQFLIGMLITELLMNLDSSDFYSDMNYDNKIVSKVLKYIDENYEEASLKEIAVILKQPNYKISKLLKEFTGKNFRELLIEKRLEKVKKLLKNTDYPISEVIKNAGYENISYFYKLFKKTYNVSLKEYRNS